MNQENLKWFTGHGSKHWVVASPTHDTPRLFCNGYIICRADGLAEAIHGDGSRMVPGVLKMWREKPTASKALRDQLCGDTPGMIARRYAVGVQSDGGIGDVIYSTGGDLKYGYIDERYVRIFSLDAEFRAATPMSRFSVYEDSQLVGIVMPMRFEEAEPWGRSVPDGVIYHDCDCGEDDQDEEE